jgi:release factor glutamine methyltransferase
MKSLEALKAGSNLLKKNNISTHILESEMLLSKTLNISREKVLTNLDQEINKKNLETYKKYLERRSKNEPIAYILKEKEFWSKKFYVNKNTLIPRPETELLVEELFKRFGKKEITFLDIGTGTGCIILSLLSILKDSSGIGIDISKNAVLTAKKNMFKHKMQNRVKFFNRPFESVFGKKFDLIVSNPPYIDRKDLKNLSDEIKKFEPRIALDGGNDGLDVIKKIIYKSKSILKIKGTLALEIGNEQIKKVSEVLNSNNFRIDTLIKDYKNNVRSLLATYK